MNTSQTDMTENTTASASADNPGVILRQARERKGMSLAHVANQLHFSESALCLLEEGAFDQLPGHTFSRGYIRAYAKLVGLDQAEMVSLFDRYTGTDSSGSTVQNLEHVEEPVRGSRNINVLRIVSLVLLVLLIGFGYYWWHEHSGSAEDSGLSLERVEVESADGTTEIHTIDEPDEQLVLDGQHGTLNAPSALPPEGIAQLQVQTGAEPGVPQASQIVLPPINLGENSVPVTEQPSAEVSVEQSSSSSIEPPASRQTAVAPSEPVVTGSPQEATKPSVPVANPVGLSEPVQTVAAPPASEHAGTGSPTIEPIMPPTVGTVAPAGRLSISDDRRDDGVAYIHVPELSTGVVSDRAEVDVSASVPDAADSSAGQPSVAAQQAAPERTSGPTQEAAPRVETTLGASSGRMTPAEALARAHARAGAGTTTAARASREQPTPTSTPNRRMPSRQQAPAPSQKVATTADTALFVAIPDQGRITVSFDADCWMQLTDADGQVLATGLRRKGNVIDISGKKPLQLRLGYAPGAHVTFNGKPVDMSAYTTGETAVLILGQ